MFLDEGFYKIKLKPYGPKDAYWTVAYHHGDGSWVMLGNPILIHTNQIAHIGERIKFDD